MNKDDINTLSEIKKKIFSLNIHKNTKLEIYSNIKKYLQIYNNYENYDYKHNWLTDLNDTKIYLFNTISSLNIAVPDEEENISELFILVENYINNKHSRFNNKHVYNFLDYPSGFDESRYLSHLF